ncbi:PAS domain S-box protein [Caenimonas sedimenti]|uniref:histidine kinase n=1 Tax=Caenimonas sedimenti TaxID=2596921 RepID=A0A562ZQG7_9BURK|nr:PAS domain S-box protein [Caenimonas sedimenti]
MLLLVALAACGGREVARRAPPAISGGVLDLRDWDFARDGTLNLDGQWELVWARFEEPDLVGSPAAAPGHPVRVPGGWNDAPYPGGPPGPDGHGTYRLIIDCYQARGLALALPVQHSAVRVFANGRLVAQQGTPAADPNLARPAPVRQIADLGEVACPIRLAVHISNHDMRRGGLVRSMEFGTAAQLHALRERAVMRDVFTLGVLAAMVVMPLLFWLARRQDRSPLWFGLFSLSVGCGLALTGSRVLEPLLAPLGWDGYLRVVFLCWYWSTAVYVLFLGAIYPRQVRGWPVRLVVLWAGLSSLVVLATTARTFTVLVPVLIWGAAAIAVYCAVKLALLLRNGERNAAWLLGGLAIFAAASAHDTMNFSWLQRDGLVPYALFFFAMAPAVMLAQRFARALSAQELRSIEQRERADLLVRSTKAGVLDWAVADGTLAYSQRFREMLGLPVAADAAPAPNFYEMVHADDRERVREHFESQLRDRSVRSGVRTLEPLECRLLQRGGWALWVHAEGIAVCGANGRPLRFLWSFIDVSERKQHEIEMSDRLKFIDDLFDSVPLGLALRDPEGKYLYVNRTWERYMGLSRDSVLGASLEGVRDPAAASALALDREALALGPDVVQPAIEYDYNGRRYMQSRTVMVDGEGRNIGVLVASVDISDKHQMERALSTERERLGLLVRSTRAGFGDWDANRDVVTYTERFKEMLGYAADADSSGWPSIFEMMHPDDRERARAEFKAMIRRKPGGGDQDPGEPMSYRLRRRDGSYIWIHAEGIAQVDASGRTRRFITSYLDVTRFREQEEALRRSRDEIAERMKHIDDLVTRLEVVVRAAQVGIVDWDGHTHQTYYSPRFREIRGYSPDADTSNWPDYFKVMIHPEDRERITRRWITFIRGKGPEGPRGEYYAPEEYRMLRADGTYAWVQVSGVAVRDSNDFAVRWIAAVIDISERHAQQEVLRASRDQIAAQADQLEQQNEALKENVRLREEVERIGRHDLKTPLNSIVAVPRLLREERNIGPEADELLGIIERAGYRILSMVNLSLDLYKMEQGNYIFRPDAVDLVDLAQKVMADVRVHAAAKEVRIDVQADGAPYAWAEELLCYSLIANLLKNAVEASPEGGKVQITIEAAEDGQVALSIHNRGAVPLAIRGSFFRKYATLGKASGTGLGAYSAHLMAKVQDGSVTMQSSDEEGTTLRVLLRAAPAGQVPATLRHAGEQRAVDPARLASLPPVRVLLVDDDEYNLLIVRRFLPDPPFTVDTAINGRFALTQAEKAWPEMIFMDLDMPVMGGLEAVVLLREMEAARGGARCAMVALSSHEDAETQQRALDAGFDRYLTKPVTREAIQQALVELHQGLGDVVVLDPDIEPVLAGFVASRRTLIGELETAAGRGDRPEVRRLAHQLAGSFALYGFSWASECSRALEKDFESVSAQQVSESAEQLRRHLDTVEIRFHTAGA